MSHTISVGSSAMFVRFVVIPRAEVKSVHKEVLTETTGSLLTLNLSTGSIQLCTKLLNYRAQCNIVPFTKWEFVTQSFQMTFMTWSGQICLPSQLAYKFTVQLFTLRRLRRISWGDWSTNPSLFGFRPLRVLCHCVSFQAGYPESVDNEILL